MAKRTWIWGALVVVAIVAWFALRDRAEPPPPALAGWEQVVAVAEPPRGVAWTDLESLPEVGEALQGTDPSALVAALDAAKLEALWVPAALDRPWGTDKSLLQRFSAAGIVPGFRGVHLAAPGMLYAIDRTTWPRDITKEALARATRQILEGGDPPPIDAYPSALRRQQSVEVLVLLRSSEGPRLWRSARAESIAEGLNTAALAARTRWEERRESMGGPLGERLDDMDVEVALLFDDGTIDRGAVTLIDSLVKPAHGVAYQQPTRWRYLLPTATHDGRAPTEAFRELFVDNGLPVESFNREDLRLYRSRMRTVSVDRGSAGSRRAGEPSGSAGGSGSSSSGASVSNEGSGSSAGSKTTNVVPNP